MVTGRCRPGDWPGPPLHFPAVRAGPQTCVGREPLLQSPVQPVTPTRVSFAAEPWQPQPPLLEKQQAAARLRLWQSAVLIAGCLAYARVVGDYFVMDDFQLLERASRTPWWGAFRAWPSFEGLSYYWLAPLGTN